MLKVLSPSLTGGFKNPILFISIILMNLYGCKSTQQGQEAIMTFPYPCDSTKVTLRHSFSAPFYHSTDGSSLSLPDDQVHRFKVQNRIENGNCSLDLTISNLMRSDEGTYFSSIYKDGLLRDDYTTRIWLEVDYPPGKASCIVSDEKVGDWVSIDCTANVGSLSGKIECYQDGVWMLSLTAPSETDTLLRQTILIRKSQPVFCCSSAVNEYKERCECNDTGLYITDDDSNNPCPPLSETTTMPLLSTLTQSHQNDYYSNMTSCIPINMDKCVIIHSILMPIEVMLLVLSLFFHYTIKTKIRNNRNVKDPPIPLHLDTPLLQLMKNRLMKSGPRKNTESA